MEIVVIGTGYVGLVTGACLASVGNTVYCVDININTITMLQNGKVHIYEPQLEELVTNNIKEGRLFFTTSLQDVLYNADIVFICVGTPTREDGSCNIDYVHGVAHEIARTIEHDCIVVMKSTVPVGTTADIQKIINKGIEERGCSYTVECVSNPEFLKEGSAVEDFKKPDRIIIGIASTQAKEVFEELYSPFSRSKNKIVFMSIASAEMSKYAANAMLATKISFINEMAQLCEKNGADISEVRIGIGSDSRIGYSFIYPGIGYGGSCFPKDVKALMYQGKMHNLPMNILHATEEVNQQQKQFLMTHIRETLEPLGGVQGKIIALWGVAFKPNTDDIREAPAIYTIEQCLAEGAYLRVYDPVAQENAKKYFANSSHVFFAKDMYEAIEGADILCIATEWSLFHRPDFVRMKLLLQYPYIIDGRNIYSYEMLSAKGFTYICVGNGVIQSERK